MSIEVKFIVFQTLIIIPFILGFVIKRFFSDTALLSKRIVTINLIFIEPAIELWVIWAMAIQWELTLLPLAGLALMGTGFILGRTLAPLMKLRGKSRATFIISSSLANHGFTMGGFLCYLFLGEIGLALSIIFLLYFVPYIYLAIFPYGGFSANREGYRTVSFREFIFNVRNMPIYAVILALALNLSGIQRPDFAFPVDVFIMISVALYYLMLGTNFQLSDTRSFHREQAFLSFIKFIFLPALVFGITRMVELNKTMETVLMIQSFMPAAIYSVVTSVLYDLDSRMASSLFILNTLIFVVLVLPLLFFFKEYWI